MSHLSSKTGLIPVPDNKRKKIHKPKTDDDGLLEFFSRKISRPIELSVRPFGDLYNPFASSRCSVLCNHPAPQVLRNIIKNAKQSKSPDCKNCISKKNDFDDFELDDQNTIPEELFRRFRDTDSRPMTPSPTTAVSIQTRTSANGSYINTRRCITPECGKSDNIKRKQIILDLRRSHSQETIMSKGASDMSYGIDNKSRVSEPKSSLIVSNAAAAVEEFKPILTTIASTTFIEQQQPVVEAQPQQQQQLPIPCINDRDDIEDQEDHRRGKKRKKLKQQPTFHLNSDPETQVSTLGPESVNVSTRPSLIPIPESIIPIIDVSKRSEEFEALKDSFLTVEAFRVLSPGLDVDILENTFERYMHRALQEAMKFMSLKKSKILISDDSATAAADDKPKELCYEINCQIPRKLSKSACRFEIPLDLNELERINVVQYLTRYVWVSRQRKQIFKRIFLRHLDTSEEAQQTATERVMILGNFKQALYDVLGFYGTDAVIEKIIDLIELEKHNGILTFRTWCGIVSFAERLALIEDIKTHGGGDENDSCEELEKSDFDTFEERRVFCVTVPEKLATVLGIIRSVQRSEYWQQYKIV